MMEIADLDKESVLHKIRWQIMNVTSMQESCRKEVQESLDLVVLSPGVPTDLPIVKGFYDQGLPVWGEVELAYQTGKGEVLAITGTNGKTTTTALLGKDHDRCTPICICCWKYWNSVYIQVTGDDR